MARKIHGITKEERAEVQRCLLHMLNDIDRVCHKHHITYMLGGGTALGAVRHQGFIPWDDDLDINMPRADYDRFLRVMQEELGEYYDFSYPHSEHVDYPFLKIYKKGTRFVELFDDMSYEGLWVDIFPIEYAPANPVIRHIKGKLADILFHGLAASLMIAQKKNEETKSMYAGNWRKKARYYMARLIGGIFFFLSYKTMVNGFDRFVCCDKKSSIMTVPTGRAHYLGECLPTSDVFPVRKIIFCGREVNVYNHVERYLTRLYGDYMQIPPENKREKHYIAEFSLSEDIQWKAAGGEQVS
ncbi:LicD family protein [Selenomonas montiformis]|uniref:LicD family protein n=1 Tax=Selenomonas montiformis TaxID=2652285 RepID=UPI003F8CD440